MMILLDHQMNPIDFGVKRSKDHIDLVGKKVSA
jgi:hypothetical protein